MRFMMMVKCAEDYGQPPKELMDAMGKLIEEANQSGTMIDTGGLAPTAMSVRVRLAGGELSVIDGPFTESKEAIGGYAMFELKSKEEEIAAAVKFMEIHKQHWPAWTGETEVRQIFGPQDDHPCMNKLGSAR